MTREFVVSVGQYDMILGTRVYFDPVAGSVRHLHGLDEPVALDPDSTRVLLEFARTPQTLLGFEHLTAALTSGDRAVEDARYELARIIRSLRQTLRDVDPTSIYIAKMPRLGYMLVAPVTLIQR